jgi:magnesium chelatase family protein
MWYTPISGIWQPVWLERVPQNHVSSLRITPTLDSVTIDTVGGETEKLISLQLPSGVREYRYSGDSITLCIDEPILWTPDAPYLYEFTLSSGNDKISSYFALRTVSIVTENQKSYIALNGKPIFCHGLLDQGYFSDGIFLPADPCGYERDILKAKELGYTGVILPTGNAAEAAVVSGITVYGADNLAQVIRFLNNEEDITPHKADIESCFYSQQSSFPFDFSEVRGQESVKRAFEVAAAGGHNLIMVGPPGSGKSMMAKRLPSILPPLTLEESLETTKIHSVSGMMQGGASLITQRPFRSPHHTISSVALCGGGGNPKPGEISLAHNGVLFLDELPEFSRDVLEVMRQPLEDRKICVARASYKVEYPAGVMLVASMNPCPCGYYNHPTKACTCNPGQVQRYLNKISGPLLDRIDLQIEIVPVPFEEISKTAPGEPSAAIRERVIAARKIQEERFKDEPGIHCNAQMTPKLIAKYAVLDETSLAMLKTAMARFDLSARAYDRILKVARTIADLDNSGNIQPQHIAEAIGYRNLDRESWGT